jgi:hypothetical protein
MTRSPARSPQDLPVSNELELQAGALRIQFAGHANGLPSRVAVREADGRETVLFDAGAMGLELELADGRLLHPVAGPGPVVRYEQGGASHVDFVGMRWQTPSGETVPDLRLSLQHEFYPDGTAFTHAFFCACSRQAPEIVRFELVQQPDCSGFDEIRWSVPGRPKLVDGTLILAGVERFLPRGEARTFDGGLFPMACFNLTREFAPSLYAEFFMEGCNSLSKDPADSASGVTWQGGSPTLRWTFQKRPYPRPIINQWRNQWGWVIRPASAQRHQPPLRMYHYFDNYRRYPEPDQVKAIAAAGCDVLVMHENWRLDAQNDGIPFEPVRFARLLEELHAEHIRLAVYVRGNEDSIAEHKAAWFDRHLKRNFDGLYVDYGGPCHEVTPPDESCNGGRLHLRKHYLKWRALRQRVGEDGVLYSHTGPFFSAIGMPFVDGYVSGEGERGLLVRGRAEHEYYSMAPVITGTMWVAAFPEYASPRMAPFLAATGQYPHNTLGRQFPTSSLVHPPEPGINDAAFRTLWRIWSVLRAERDLAVFNDYNSRGVFPRDRETGHYLMVSQDRRVALLVLSNFRDEGRRDIDCTVAWPFKPEGMNVRLLAERESHQDACPAMLELPGYGVAGLLLTAPGVDVDALLAEYRRPAPELGVKGRAYLAEVADQRRLREDPPVWENIHLFLSVPPSPPATYEESLIVDLYNNTFELIEIEADGTLRPIAWIDKRGAVREPSPEAQLAAGDCSPPVELAGLLPPGVRRLAVRSLHLGEEFYSFCQVTLSPTSDPDDRRAYRLEFFNDLEPNRARITFLCRLPEPLTDG